MNLASRIVGILCVSIVFTIFNENFHVSNALVRVKTMEFYFARNKFKFMMIICGHDAFELFLTLFKQFFFQHEFFFLFFSQKNTIIFEKMECYQNRNGHFSSVKCEMKRVSREHIKINLVINLTKPVNDVWIHGVFYYKYNRYQKFPIDLWESVCAWLGGTGKSYMLEWTTRKILKYSNLNHSCPYNGTIFVKADRLSLKDLLAFESLLPAGRFRLDINMTEGYAKKVFFIAQMFFAISDNRIERF